MLLRSPLRFFPEVHAKVFFRKVHAAVYFFQTKDFFASLLGKLAASSVPISNQTGPNLSRNSRRAAQRDVPLTAREGEEVFRKLKKKRTALMRKSHVATANLLRIRDVFSRFCSRDVKYASHR